MASAATTVVVPARDIRKTPMTSAQDGLPRLPVPDLAVTVAKFLRTARPLTSDAEYALLSSQAQQFLAKEGLGHILQTRLLERAAQCKDRSWLIDWWNSLAYLAFRAPVVINVSYFYQFKDDPDASRMTQTKRAASLIHGAMTYRDMVVTGTLPIEKMRDTPLCMHTVPYIFNSCRVPARGEDVTATFDPAANSRILVVRKNRFFTFDANAADGTRLTPSEVERQLEHIVEVAGTAADEAAVGALTSADRDDLADYYERLLNAHPANATTLREIQASVFAVCLDDSAPGCPTSQARALLHGDGENRWFDKTSQFIVFSDGRAGFMGEHSPMDGQPTASMCNWLLHGLATRKLAVEPSTSSSGGKRALLLPTRHDFRLSKAVLEDISAARAAFRQLIDDHEVAVMQFKGYGKEQVKKFKCSPDAWTQMAIQLAYYSVFGECRATYESASTRKFLRGRTETIRSVSVESVAFCKAMRDPKAKLQDRAAKLQAAAAAHVKYARMCGNAQGVDRHLLGLRLLRKPGEDCDLFKNPVFYRTGHWFISTSNLTSEYFANWGWGEVVPDGIGVAYSTLKHQFNFNLTCRKGMNSAALINAIRLAMQEMCDTMKAAASIQGGGGAMRAKL